MAKKSIEGYLLFNKPTSIFPYQYIASICIDKDPVAQFLLRHLLYKEGIHLTNDLVIHAGVKEDLEGFVTYYFLNEDQNRLIKQINICEI